MRSHPETERIRLREFTPADEGWLADLHGDPAVMRYLDAGQPVPREVVVGQTLPGILREYQELPSGLGLFAAVSKADGSPIGWFGLRPPSSAGLDRDVAGSVELGYRLFPATWGRGYATEGALALVSMAFTELGADRVVATTMTVNVASRRVLEKAGLTLVRTFFLQWPTYLAGAEHGEVEYALARTQWPPATTTPARAADRR